MPPPATPFTFEVTEEELLRLGIEPAPHPPNNLEVKADAEPNAAVDGGEGSIKVQETTPEVPPDTSTSTIPPQDYTDETIDAGPTADSLVGERDTGDTDPTVETTDFSSTTSPIPDASNEEAESESGQQPYSDLTVGTLPTAEAVGKDRDREESPISSDGMTAADESGEDNEQETVDGDNQEPDKTGEQKTSDDREQETEDDGEQEVDDTVEQKTTDDGLEEDITEEEGTESGQTTSSSATPDPEDIPDCTVQSSEWRMPAWQPKSISRRELDWSHNR